MRITSGTLAIGVGLITSGCTPDPSDRWLYHPDEESLCKVDTYRCAPELEHCSTASGAAAWAKVENCSKQDLVCSARLGACTACLPDKADCDEGTVITCASDGSGWVRGETCDESGGEACREGVCAHLCSLAAFVRSNVGCEYWGVDLDNANVDATLNAAAQQYAIVVSNPQPDVTASITIEQDDTLPGEDNDPYVIADAKIAPLSLRVFPLGPREVDGSEPGTFDTGTNTALTRAAFRVRSSFPVVAYQFNPLANVGVFSNDASLLKPREALDPDGEGVFDQYVVAGWPQTIAHSDDPRVNFDSKERVDLRAFLTLVGTTDDTTLRVKTTARFVGAPGIPETDAGGELEMKLGAFDVVNLETEGFNADFTGSVVSADHAIVAFSGSEASDAPYFSSLGKRYCCADHLEEQLDHLRTAGLHFIAAATPNRTDALIAAGAALGHADQADYFRIVAVTANGAHVETSLASPASFDLAGRGDFVDIGSADSFAITSDFPITLMSVSASQEAAGVPRDLPGGDPSALVIPPIEQFRSDYVFLTPDQYAYDFVRIMAPEGAKIVFDEKPLADWDCADAPAGSLTLPLIGTTQYVVHTCQLGFPVIDPLARAPDNFTPGIQNDGVHVIQSDQGIGVLVDGFDRFVSYAYAAGTELSFIVPR